MGRLNSRIRAAGIKPQQPKRWSAGHCKLSFNHVLAYKPAVLRKIKQHGQADEAISLAETL